VSGGPTSDARRLGELLRRVELAGLYQRAARARQTGEHQAELLALEYVSVAGGLTPGELGRRLGLTSGGVTALTSRLSAAGYLTARPHPCDRRMKILVNTAEGEAQIARQLEPVVTAAHQLLASVPDEDAGLLEWILEGLVALKEEAAATTPGPEPERACPPYSHAVLM
jgi:DNA-binding MarR family transcriptional regulator